MSVSMRPVIASAVRSRWPLPLLTLGIAMLGRAIGSGRVDWHSSDLQLAFGGILYGALIPLLVIALASGLLRGEHGPWAWALARPVSRARWLGTTAIIDAVTVLACVGAVYSVIGTMPDRWVGSDGGAERALGYGAAITGIYAAAAFGGARGATAIGAALYAAALASITVALQACAAIVEQLTRVTHRWGYYRAVTDALGEVPASPTIALVLVFVLAATLRAAARLPARPRLRPLLRSFLITAILACVVVPWLGVLANPSG